MTRRLFLKIGQFPKLDCELLSNMSLTIEQTYKKFIEAINPKYNHKFKDNGIVTIEHDSIHFDNLCCSIMDKCNDDTSDKSNYKFNLYVGEEMDGVVKHRVYIGLLPIKIREQIEELPRLYLVTFKADNVCDVPQLDEDTQMDNIIEIKEE